MLMGWATGLVWAPELAVITRVTPSQEAEEHMVELGLRDTAVRRPIQPHMERPMRPRSLAPAVGLGSTEQAERAAV